MLERIEEFKKWHGSYKSYLIGFSGSLILTTLAFFLVLQGHANPFRLTSLALLQAILQLLCFLHLGQEPKPYWETIVFLFMVVILLIISLGSLWIMNDLNSRMMMTMYD